ncbi:helix-hairpin-helix domain-containing protein [Clostridium sp. SHJSY1]|uniref:helix-hairpin-helix domain-containing protein n=1 Tax=Clostridium sp. SHJSY1 TaxID=2942483 RepID=UPI0028741323|nr:helix-hairpin-helix domain-containing protein [Clostridium sp. SHJSY1]MDS0528385.1 helix-hairpin-helix domain-containing protein [Clostridium sp. SHJSY1]
MNKKYKSIGVVTLLIGVTLFILYSYYFKNGEKELNKNETESMFIEDKVEPVKAENNEKQIVVEIKGEINSPNVYWIKEDSIVEDLIKMAGGIKEGADISKINRAEKLKNHQSVIIPNKNDSKNIEISSPNTDVSRPDIIDINTADEKKLDTLPGIGLAKAKEIISYREENGEFKSIEDLKNVKGIGDSLFEKIKDKIAV